MMDVRERDLPIKGGEVNGKTDYGQEESNQKESNQEKSSQEKSHEESRKKGSPEGFVLRFRAVKVHVIATPTLNEGGQAPSLRIFHPLLH